MSLAASLLPSLLPEQARTFSAETAHEALSAAQHLRTDTLDVLARKFPVAALQLAQPSLSAALLRACAQAAPHIAIDLRLTDLLTVEEQAATLKELPHLLSRLTAEQVQALPVPLLQNLLVVAPETVLSIIAAVDRLPRLDLAKVADAALRLSIAQEGRYNYAAWSTHRVRPEDMGRTLRLFTVSIGQQGQGFEAGRCLDHVETNLYTAGTLPVDFQVRAIRYNLLGGSDADAQCFMENASLYVEMQATTILDVEPLSGFGPHDNPRYGTIHREKWGHSYERGGNALVLPANRSFAVQIRTITRAKLQGPLDVRVTLLGTSRP